MGTRSTQKCWGKLVSQLETRDREWPGALWGLKLSFIGEENAQGEGGRKGARWARNSFPGWVTTTCHDLVFRFSWLTFVFFEGFPSLQIYMMNPREAPISDCEGLHSDGQVWEGPLTLAISFLSQLLMWLLEGKKNHLCLEPDKPDSANCFNFLGLICHSTKVPSWNCDNL